MNKYIVNTIFAILFLSSLFLGISVVGSENNKIQNVNLSINRLDFGRCPSSSEPKKNFYISNFNDAVISDKFQPSSNWITIESNLIADKLLEVIVQLDLTNLPLGFHEEKIELITTDKIFTIPLQVEIVENKQIMQFVFDNPLILLNGKITKIDYPPFVANDQTYLPLRFICEGCGSKLLFTKIGDEKRISITVLFQNLDIRMQINDDFITINGKKVEIKTPILLKSGITFIPIDLVEKIFKPEIQFNSLDRLTTIIY